jgi:hypothetical protein
MKTITLCLLLVYTYHGKHVETCTYACPHHDEFEDEGNMFGVGASFEGSLQALVNGKLSLFRRLSMLSSCI